MPEPSTAELDDAVARLGLQLDGAPWRSLSSLVCRVTLGGQPAYLKVTNEQEELVGARALEQWNGSGAVRVLARSGNAIVLERAGRTLRSLVTDDDLATRVLCDVADRLHRHHPSPLDEPLDEPFDEPFDEFPTLRTWFSSLFADASPRFDQVRMIAARLLDQFTSAVLLHGDLHHENVLYGGDRGWLAIDPKGIVGPREFDYCNIFTNWSPQQAIEHFDSRLHIVARTADIDRVDLLRWIASWSALSGIWHLEDGDQARGAFAQAITDLALQRLRICRALPSGSGSLTD